MKTILIILIQFAFLTPQIIFGQEKDSVSQEDKRADGYIRNCNQSKYSRYLGKIEICKTPNYVYYEIDSIRVYMFAYFINSFKSKSDSVSKRNFDKFQQDVGLLFEKGFVTGKMFICEIFEDCKYFSSLRYLQKGDSLIPYKPDLFGYTGPTIKILNIEERDNFKIKTSRRFEIWVSLSKSISNSFDVYYVELTNEKAENETRLDDFIKGARLTCFGYGHTQI